MNIFKNRVFNSLFFIVLSISLFFVFIFHSDSSYIYIKRNLNNKLQRYVGINLISTMNNVGEVFDIKGYFQQNSVSDSRIIDLKLKVDQIHILDSLAEIRKKDWIPISFQVNDSIFDARLKLHGTHSIHYSDNSYSFRIKMPKSKCFRDMKEFSLIKAEDISIAAVAANQLAADFGLIAPTGQMIELKVNTKVYGAYFMVDKINRNYLKQHFGIEESAIIVNLDDWDRKENELRNNPHMSDHDLFSGHIEKKKGNAFNFGLNNYQCMTTKLKQGDVEGVVDYFDRDYMARFLALASLFNDVHFLTGDNLKLVYNVKKAKFYPLFRKETEVVTWDTKVWKYSDVFKNTFPNFNKILFESQPDTKGAESLKIFKCLLRDEILRQKRDQYLYILINQYEKILSKIKIIYDQNRSILLRHDFSRRCIDVEYIENFNQLNKNLNLAKDYLTYAKVFGTVNQAENMIYLRIDAFSPVICKINSSDTQLLVGTYFDKDLNYFYKEFKFEYQREMVDRFMFINGITKHELNSKDININYSKYYPKEREKVLNSLGSDKNKIGEVHEFIK